MSCHYLQASEKELFGLLGEIILRKQRNKFN